MPLIGVRYVLDLLFLVDDLEWIVIGLQQRNCPAALHFLIDLVVVDGAAPADNTEHRYGVPQTQRCHFARAGQQPCVAEYRHRTYAAEEGARADRNGLGFATYRHMMDLIVLG